MWQSEKGSISRMRPVPQLLGTLEETFVRHCLFSRRSRCSRTFLAWGRTLPRIIDYYHPPSRPDLSSNITIAKPDWETYCIKVAEMIVKQQTPEQVMAVRGKLYELLSHCIPPTVILKVRLVLSLLGVFQLGMEIISLSDYSRSRGGNGG